MNFPKIGDKMMCNQFGSAKKYFFDRPFFEKIFFDQKNRKIELEKKVREAIWEVRSTPSGREATVTERAARFNADPSFHRCCMGRTHNIYPAPMQKGGACMR